MTAAAHIILFNKIIHI